MITNNELQISNMSYTNRDFQSIYPELLDLVKQMTNKWDPSISNESDPGNVLLKLLAAVGDKNNYNIDKNVLECFMPSATQETSMRKLTDAVGYNMKYYRAAMTDISFKYTGDLTNNLKFERFGTTVSNSDNTVSYTLIQDVVLSYKNVASSGLAIEGTLNSLLVGDNEVIKLENLDDNNRLYFPEIYVAENGVFITNDGTTNFDDWTKVENLNTQLPLTRCYKFSYDSEENLPYIEFPSDMAQLIDAGIRVWYITTMGAAGNVSANTLTELTSTTLTDFNQENLIIFNPTSSSNGADKETIDEAYSNFKKIIGTFDTLVTARDYANAIYNLTDEYNAPLVSNAAVADRTTDINSALKFVSYDTNGQYVDLVPNAEMSVADLKLLPLSPYKGENYNMYRPEAVYDQSYAPFKNVKIDGYTYTDNEVLVSDLDNMKCIGHVFQDMVDTEGNRDIYNFKAITSLDVQIFTYSKVNLIAQADIVSNVTKALSDNFNARKVEYGYELPYEDILNVIYAADSRIKSVSLSDPEYNVNIVYTNGDVEPLDENVEVANEIIAKNVLAGKLSLFLYDGRFDWRFGQTDVNIYDNVVSISTSLTIPQAANTTSGTFSYTIDKNEAIQFIAPNLTTNTIYPAGVYYRFTNSGSSSTNVIVPANSDYELSATEALQLYWVDSEENVNLVTITSATTPNIIKPSFDMYYIDASSNTIGVDIGGTTFQFVRIDTNQTLETREYVSVSLKNIGTPVYWIMNNSGNVLFEENQMNVLLDANEYFIYSNSNLDDLVVLGSGTLIERTGDTSRWAIDNTVSLEAINVNGLSAFTSNDWQYKQFTSTNYLTINEMQIITLGENTTLNITDMQLGDSATAITTEWNSVTGTISYVSNNVVETLPQRFDSNNWNVRARLDLNAGPDSPQELITNTNKAQSLTLITTSNVSGDVIDGASQDKYLMFNYPVSVAGGNNVDMLVTNVLTGTTSYALSANIYVNVEPSIVDSSSQPTSDIINTASNINVPLSESKTLTLPLNIEYINTEQPSQEEIEAGISGTYNYQPYGTYIVPLLFTQGLVESGDTPTYLTLSSNCADLFEYNVHSGGNKQALSTVNASGLYNVELVAKWLGEYDSISQLNAERPEYAEITFETEPDDWADIYTNYYTESGGVYTQATSTFDPTETYYIKPNTDGDICKVNYTYTLLSTEPADWSTNYTHYYTYDSGTHTYSNVTGASAPTFASNTYYSRSVGSLYEWDATATPAAWVSQSITPSDYTLTIAATVDQQITESFMTVGKINKILNLNGAIVGASSGDGVLESIEDLTTGITDASGNPITFYYTYTPENADVIETDNMLSASAFWDVNNVANKFTIPAIDFVNSRIYIARSSQL